MPLDIVSIAALARLGQADELEQLGALGRAAGRAGEALVQDEQLVGRRPAREAEQLGQVAERAARRRAARARPAHLGAPAARAHEPAGDLHERRLARAVGAEQSDDLALADLEVHAAQRVRRAVALGQSGDGEGRGHAASVGMRVRPSPRSAP